jgi:hypothetical protein
VLELGMMDVVDEEYVSAEYTKGGVAEEFDTVDILR